MRFLDTIFDGLEEYRELCLAAHKRRFPLMATGLSAVHKAHLIHSMCMKLKTNALVLAADESEAQKLCADLTAMGTKAVYYPARDFTFREIEGVSGEFEHQRIGALYSFMTGESRVLVACADGALQYTIPPAVLQQTTVTVREGDEVSLNKTVEALVMGGYARTDSVEGKGQFAQRGGILDFFMPSADLPCRVEFWGDEVDTISYFDPETQRRTESAGSFVITPSSELMPDDAAALADKIEAKSKTLRGKSAAKAKEIMAQEASVLRSGGRLTSIDKYYSLIYDKPADVFDYLGKQSLVFVSEQPKQKERLKAALWQWGEDLKSYLESGVLCKGLDSFSGYHEEEIEKLSKHNTVFIDSFARGSCELPLRELVNFNLRQLSVWGGSVTVLCEDIDSRISGGATCVVLAGTAKMSENIFKELCARGYSPAMLYEDSTIDSGGLYIAAGSLSSGFEYPSIGFSLISYAAASAAPRRTRKSSHSRGKAVFSLSDLSPGDYVVHSTYGIGVFEGIHDLTFDGVTKDYIKIRYANGDRVNIPVTQLDMVSKYIGPREDSNIRLSRLGGGEWQKAKSRVRKAVADIAEELTKLYAERMKVKGYAFSVDHEWQMDFESRFEYEETFDQKRCIAEIKKDMESAVPMDRLLCGDVGFGKTEVALRAAFKCVADSKQCALLCPTTILAWQHYQTALKRFEGFPVNIELLSRFRTAGEQRTIIKKLERGEIDFIIGTHRLVSKDIKFRDLGLVIIDEEQRFGVAQKERFKEQCKNVDVLTLSATPIPRTLNMAMSGIRDMSVIEEAPQDRRPVQTYVLEYDDSVIYEAIRRELRRGGQVFFLHNSVEDIEERAAQISENIPEAKVGVGHGKMDEDRLSEVWQQMLEQEINVLVSTTIIETGVDIPNANTLIIENADRMGLSQLHQIRGRVGRSSRRAYAYFTFKKDKVISELSQKRLNAIRDFTEFGSGFKIAMRDLELRGAGSILGAKQHGHMADVGYEMYMKLLGEAVESARGEVRTSADADCVIDVHINAHLPEDYISNLNTRLEVYRRIADIRTEEDASDVIDELIDRFGDPPDAVNGLVNVALLRNKAMKAGISEIKQLSENLHIFVTRLDCEGVATVLDRYADRATLCAGEKPYISVRLRKNEKIKTVFNELFDMKF